MTEEANRPPTIFEADTAASASEPSGQSAEGVEFDVGTDVWVPTRYLDGEQPFAVTCRKITQVGEDTVDVAGGTSPIKKARVRKVFRIVVLTCGDFASEFGTLDPLSKSVVQFLRLMVPDEALTSYKIRSASELDPLWKREREAATILVLAGHASADGMVLGGQPNALSADAIVTSLELNSHALPRRTIVCLACQTGTAPFARTISAASAVDHVIAPFKPVHAVVGSLFAQTFFACHLLQGLTVPVAFNRALSDRNVADARYRLWTRGELAKGATGG
ncbi:MAG: hypothetical protein IPK71_12015 [Myxococcales bacterium]|nr:hypothetical protein [Myxococcales bacterium]